MTDGFDHRTDEQYHDPDLYERSPSAGSRTVVDDHDRQRCRHWRQDALGVRR